MGGVVYRRLSYRVIVTISRQLLPIGNTTSTFHKYFQGVHTQICDSAV